MVGEGGRRRTRESGERRSERVGVAFTPTELALVKAAAGRVGMSAAGWVGQQTMAVAQHVLVPVSAHRADVLRDLVQARAGLREIAVRLDTLDVLATATDTAPDTAAGTGGTVSVTVQQILADIRAAVLRVDTATVAVMRERQARS